MSDTFSRVEVITGVARRRRFSTDVKPAIVAETAPVGWLMMVIMAATTSPGGPSLQNLPQATA